MRKLLALECLTVCFIIATAANGQQLRYIAIDGTMNPPRIIQTNLAPGDRPTITRIVTVPPTPGAYILKFPFNVQFFSGDVQRGAGGFDGPLMIFTSKFNSTDLTTIQIQTWALDPGAAPPATPRPPLLRPYDGRLSITVVR